MANRGKNSPKGGGKTPPKSPGNPVKGSNNNKLQDTNTQSKIPLGESSTTDKQMDGIRTRNGAKKDQISDQSQTIFNVPTRNTYDVLNNNQSVDEQNVESDKSKKIKIPPVFISKESVKFSDLVKDIKNLTKDFMIKDIKEFFKLDLMNIDDYRNVIKLLNNKMIQYHSYRLPTEKTLDVVLKHIPTSITDEEICEELTNMGFKIYKLKRIENKEKSPIPVVSMYLFKNHDANKDIFNLNRLFNCVVSVESKRQTHTIPQCFNCQRYGHTRNYCKQIARCMKCAGNHSSSNCNQSDNLVCANCGENHTSAFKGCKYYEEIKKMRYHDRLPKGNNPGSAISETPPPLSNEFFPTLSQRQTVDQVSIHSSSFSIHEHSYAKIVKNSKGSVNINQANDKEKDYTKDSSNGNEYMSNNIVDSIYEAIKPIIASVIEKLKPMLQDIIMQFFNGSK